ncbi:MAG: gamma-glutamyl-phosphate reductase, partial [Clostridiales bacterium]
MSEVVKKAQAAKKAAAKLAVLNAQAKNEALLAIAHVLEDNMDKILEANALDMKNGQENGMAQSLLDRLALNEQRIKDMALGLRQIVALPDPVGEVLSSITRPNGLIIEKIRVPLGLIGMIYEARPNVTVDSTALALKTGNG